MYKAVGAGTEIRGIRFNENRPSKLVFDDIEHSEEVENEEIRVKYENWFSDVAAKIGDENTSFEFGGTILHSESLLKKLLKNPSYDAKSYKAIESWADRTDLWEQWKSLYVNIDNDARIEEAKTFFEANKEEMMKGVKVLWPEKEPYYDLQIEIIEHGMRSFMKEKQGEPVASDSQVFQDMHWYRETDKGILIESSNTLIPWDQIKFAAYGVLDPATGKRKAQSMGDFTCILTGFKDPKGRLLVHKDYTRRESPSKWMDQIFTLHDTFKYNKFGVEENLYKELLLPNLKDKRERLEKERGQLIKLPFYEINQVVNKAERITAIEPKVSHGWIVFNRNLSDEFKSQMANYPNVSHDDCPDSVEMLYNLVNNRYKASPVSLSPNKGR